MKSFCINICHVCNRISLRNLVLGLCLTSTLKHHISTVCNDVLHSYRSDLRYQFLSIVPSLIGFIGVNRSPALGLMSSQIIMRVFSLHEKSSADTALCCRACFGHSAYTSISHWSLPTFLIKLRLSQAFEWSPYNQDNRFHSLIVRFVQHYNRHPRDQWPFNDDFNESSSAIEYKRFELRRTRSVPPPNCKHCFISDAFLGENNIYIILLVNCLITPLNSTI